MVDVKSKTWTGFLADLTYLVWYGSVTVSILSFPMVEKTILFMVGITGIMIIICFAFKSWRD